MWQRALALVAMHQNLWWHAVLQDSSCHGTSSVGSSEGINPARLQLELQLDMRGAIPVVSQVAKRQTTCRKSICTTDLSKRYVLKP